MYTMINQPATASTIVNIDADLEDLELDEEGPTAFTTNETSLSHQSSVYNLDRTVIDAAIGGNISAMRQLKNDLLRLREVAQNMKTDAGDRHQQSRVLSRLYNELLTQVGMNLSNPRNANWVEFVDHSVTTTPYMGLLSIYDQIQALSKGGFGILSKGIQGYAYISATREGWSLHVSNQTIPVMPEQLFRLLVKASRATFQSAPWVRAGAMFNSSNFDGFTMIVRPAKGATHVPVANVDGEAFAFSELRLSCSYWHYVGLLQWTIAARFPDKAVAKVPEFIELRELAQKHFDDDKHLPANAAELEYIRFVVSMHRNPNTNYFQDGKMLAEYEPEDLATIEAFLPKYNAVVSARVARRREQRNANFTYAEPVTVPENEEEHVF
jgi:hypothetical protein